MDIVQKDKSGYPGAHGMAGIAEVLWNDYQPMCSIVAQVEELLVSVD